MKRPARILLAVALAISAVSFWLEAHSGLALMVDLRTGEKHCVDELAGYLGVPQYGSQVQAAHLFSFAWMPIMAIVAICFAVSFALRRWRAREASARA